MNNFKTSIKDGSAGKDSFAVMSSHNPMVSFDEVERKPESLINVERNLKNIMALRRPLIHSHLKRQHLRTSDRFNNNYNDSCYRSRVLNVQGMMINPPNRTRDSKLKQYSTQETHLMEGQNRGRSGL